MQTKRSFIDTITAIFSAWGQLTRVLEATLIDNLAATVPWLAPIVPAYMIYHSLTVVIQFPLPVAILSAIVVEFLGLVTVSTSVQFWTWNDSKRQADPGAPVWLAVITAVAYLLIVITTNVILDLRSPIEQLLAKALLSTLSVSAAMTIAIRSQHARRLAEIEKDKAQKREDRLLARNLRSEETKETKVSRNFPTDWRKLPEEDRKLITSMPTREIIDVYQVSPRTAQNWKNWAVSTNGTNGKVKGENHEN